VGLLRLLLVCALMLYQFSIFVIVSRPNPRHGDSTCSTQSTLAARVARLVSCTDSLLLKSSDRPKYRIPFRVLESGAEGAMHGLVASADEAERSGEEVHWHC
jgi:hypothetical protein